MFDENRQPGVAYYPLGYAAVEEVIYAGTAMGAHDDQFCIPALRFTDDDIRGRTGADHDLITWSSTSVRQTSGMPPR